MKLIIPIVVVVVVVVVVALLFLPGLLGGGGTQTATETSPTNTVTNQTVTQTEKEKEKPEYQIAANIRIRDPTPEEQSRGVLKVILVSVQIRVLKGSIQLVEINLDNETTLVTFPNPLGLSAGATFRRQYKVEITTQAELDKWSKAGLHNVVFKIVVEGKEIYINKPVVYTPETTSRTLPKTQISVV